MTLACFISLIVRWKTITQHLEPNRILCLNVFPPLTYFDATIVGMRCFEKNIYL